MKSFAKISPIVTWLFRLLVGVTFLFSGFVKSIDPWGSLYKFEEYTAAMGIPVLHTVLITSVFALCALEFLVGTFILLGCYRRSAPIMAAIFMVVMLPLTLWVAIADPVKDCGCFGDALVLSNWATFWKNVVLSIMICWLVLFNRKQISIISPAFQWLSVVFSILFIGAISFHGYLVQPMIDFRPYKLNQPIAGESESVDEEYVFIYEKDGVKREFAEDDELPSEEDGWNFVDSRKLSQNTNDAGSDDDRTFRIWDRAGNVDFTDNLLVDNNSLMILMPEIQAVSPATTWIINELYDWSLKANVDMFAVVAGSQNEIAEWEDLSMPQYEIYTADDTAIKEVARGNPSVVFIDDGIVKWKSTLGALDISSLESENSSVAELLPANVESKLKEWSYLYLLSLVSLVIITMVPRIKNRVASIRDDKAHREE